MQSLVATVDFAQVDHDRVFLEGVLPSAGKLTFSMTPEVVQAVLCASDVARTLPLPEGSSRAVEIVLPIGCSFCDETAAERYSPSEGHLSVRADAVLLVAADGSSKVEVEMPIDEVMAHGIAIGLPAALARDKRDGVTNAYRAVETRDALEMFKSRTGLTDEDGLATAAGDMIAGILHAVRLEEGDAAALEAVKSGIGHHLSEAWDGDEDQPDLDFDVLVRADAPRAGVSVSVETGGPVEIDVDEARLAAYRDQGSSFPGP